MGAIYAGVPQIVSLSPSLFLPLIYLANPKSDIFISKGISLRFAFLMNSYLSNLRIESKSVLGKCKRIFAHFMSLCTICTAEISFKPITIYLRMILASSSGILPRRVTKEFKSPPLQSSVIRYYLSFDL